MERKDSPPTRRIPSPEERNDERRIIGRRKEKIAQLNRFKEEASRIIFEH